MKKELVYLSLTVLMASTSVDATVAQVRSQGVRGAAAGQSRRPGVRARARRVDPKLEKILINWEQRSSQIKTLRAEFSHLYYDEVFGKRDPETGRVIAQRGRGELVYEAPDKGVFRVYEGKKRGLLDFIERDRERWVCTGNEVYQYDNRLKQVTVTPLPPNLRGAAISEGPLPFIFGMKAQQAKQRYRMRLRTLQRLRPQDVCLEVYPLRKQDLENFSRAIVVLDTENYLPRAIQVEDPSAARAEGSNAGQPVSRSVYLFHDRNGRPTIAVNAHIRGTEFSTPTRGYHVIRNDRLVADEADRPDRRQSGALRNSRNR